MKSDILIVFPPQWVPVSPYSALPLLRSRLQRDGFRTKILDLNCMTFDLLLTEAYLNRLRLPDEFLPDDQRYPFRWLLTFRHELAKRVEHAKAIMRTPASFFDGKQYLYAENTLRYALFLISLAFQPQRLDLDSIDLGVPSCDLFSPALMGRSFGSFIFEDTMEYILSDLPLDTFSVVGFSIHTKFQLFYCLRLIKQYFSQKEPRVHLTIGGTFLSSLRRYHPTFQPIFDAGVDTVVYAQGEETLSHLCRLVAEGKNGSSCPGVIHYDGCTIHRNQPEAYKSRLALLEPDYTGLPIEKYLAPALIANIPASKGCYWGKCRFCNYHDAYSVIDSSGLSSLLDSTGRAYQTNYFFLAQSTLNYEQVMSLPNCSSYNPSYLWGSLARVDEKAMPESVASLLAAGCRKLSFGLETLSPTLRKKMNKGELSPQFEDFLSQCHAQDIGIELFLIVGYPGETTEDVHQTLNFIKRFLSYIDTLSANQFSLVCNSAAFTTMRKNDEYVVEQGELSFYEVIDQQQSWHYRDSEKAKLHNRTTDIFWKGLIDMIESSSSHIWRGNTASRCGFPRIPEHHFLYCASREQLLHLEDIFLVQQRLTPLTIGDQVISLDLDTMTIADFSDAR